MSEDAASESSDTGGGAGTHSAAGPALGYLVQVDYALLLMLDRMSDRYELELSLETLDDIAFHGDDSSPTEKFQSKHHVSRQASLGDASTDLWKTLRNWIVEGGDATLTMLTTSTASNSSAAARLRARADRNVAAAMQALERTARSSTNQTNTDYYRSFRELTPEARRALLERIIVIDGAPTAADLDDAFLLALRLAAPVSRRGALAERLRGWWHGRALQHLTAVATGQRDRISMAEVEARLEAISRSLRDDNLPIDFEDLPLPEPEEVDADTRVFVQQLQLIAMGSARMRQCINDHNRAFLQRSRWQRERLLNIGELAQYDARLQDEWRRHFTPLTADEEQVPEEEVQRLARERFQRLDTSPLPAVRREVAAGFVANGSLHMLADQLRIGWHPKWIEHLRDQLGDGDVTEAA